MLWGPLQQTFNHRLNFNYMLGFITEQAQTAFPVWNGAARLSAGVHQCTATACSQAKSLPQGSSQHRTLSVNSACSHLTVWFSLTSSHRVRILPEELNSWKHLFGLGESSDWKITTNPNTNQGSKQTKTPTKTQTKMFCLSQVSWLWHSHANKYLIKLHM